MPAHTFDYCGLGDSRWGGNVRPAPVCPSVEGGVLVSASCYHGYERVRQPQQRAVTVASPADDSMDVETSPAARALTTFPRKRSADEDGAPQLKRLREEESLPSTSKCNQYLVGPTHANPDISRCFMAHMI